MAASARCDFELDRTATAGGHGSRQAPGPKAVMDDDLCRYATSPWRFVGRYLRRRWVSHGLILAAVLGAVGCSVSTQYGVKGWSTRSARGRRRG